MCGISGFYNTSKYKVDEALLKSFISIQDHRGPDSNGYFYDSYIGMAHNRLSLIDLTDNGKQPFIDEENVLVYNGEIYNYQELIKELPVQKYNSTSDTAVLFQALKYWGIEKTLKKINGMFAFAWFNKNSGDLILARDRVGIKPLFWGKANNGTFFFSSELKAILKSHTFELNSVRTLYSTLGVLEKSNYETAWNNLYHVPPGTFIKIGADKFEEHKYYEITDLVDESEYLRLSKYKTNQIVDEFDSLFGAAVKSYLIADAPVGAFVSGGIDSSLIASYASEYVDDFKMFTANVDGKYSEIEDARFLAQYLKRELFEYKFEPQMAIRDLVDVTWHYESPVVTHFNAIPFSNVAAITRQKGVKAVLTGEGADELFLGYPKLLTRRYNALIKWPYSLLDYLYSKHGALKNYVSGGRTSGIDGMFEQAAQGFTRQMKREQTIDVYSFLPQDKRQEYYLSAQMMKEGILSLLWRNDRMGMAHSIESRFPFLDERILSFAMNLPMKFKIGRTSHFHNYKHPFLTDKFIVRKLGERKLPDQIAQKKKKGFPVVGLDHIKPEIEIFKDGFVQSLFGITKNQLEYMITNFDPYHIGKLVAVEIWGRLFVMHEEKEMVNQNVNRYLKMN